MMYGVKEYELNKSRNGTVTDIIELLKTHNKVMCNRYTGFGKSYYVVPELIKRLDSNVLLIVPSKPLLEQYGEKFANNDRVMIVTYQKLLRQSNVESFNEYSNIDYIICDECHHLGNNRWCNALTELNKKINAKIIGITATPVRGDSIDVVENYFNNIQVEPIELIDGISMGFVPKIKYVVAYAQVDDVSSSDLNEVDRYKIENLLNVPNIISKYINKDRLNNNLKVLVYVPGINYIQEAVYQCRNWFKTMYPNKNINIYNIHSNKSKTLNEKVLDKFRKNSSRDDIDIMVSVDMLTEGLHLPTISVEIMLRKTISPVIYFQQLGRVINSNQPLVFDLINNSNHLYQIKKDYSYNIEKSKGMTKYRDKVLFDECIELYDETKDIEDILKKYRKEPLIRLSSQEVDSIVLDNKQYIENNTDNLSLNGMSKYLKVSPHALQDSFIRLGINFDYTKYKARLIEYGDIVVANKDYIESNSGKITYSQLAKKLNIPVNDFYKVIYKYNIKFDSNRPRRTQKDVDELIRCNISKINQMMKDEIPLVKQAESLGLHFKPYKNALINNNIEINYLFQRFKDRYDLTIYDQFKDLYINKVPRKDIIKKFNMSDAEYRAYAAKVNSDTGFKRVVWKKGKMLTSEDKLYISENYLKYTTKELSQYLNKPQTVIKDYKCNNNLIDESKVKRKLDDAQKERIEKLYNLNSKLSLAKISKIVGCGEKAVKNHLIRCGLYTSKPKISHTEQEYNDIRNDYLNGMNKIDIEAKYHIGHKLLGEVLDDIVKPGNIRRIENLSRRYTEIAPSVLEDYSSGLAKRKIMRKYHIGEQALSYILMNKANQ